MTKCLSTVRKGEKNQPHTMLPLLTDFDAVWQKLRNTYETNIPPLAYIQPIPAAERTPPTWRLAAVLSTKREKNRIAVCGSGVGKWYKVCVYMEKVVLLRVDTKVADKQE